MKRYRLFFVDLDTDVYTSLKTAKILAVIGFREENFAVFVQNRVRKLRENGKKHQNLSKLIRIFSQVK